MRGLVLFLAIILFFGGIGLFGYYTLRAPNAEVPQTTTDAPLPNLTEPTVTIVDPVRGAREAPITIVEFGDYFCAFCQEVEGVMREVLATYPTEVRLVWKDAPNEGLHGQAFAGAEAARCAGEQNQFWAYHDLLLERAKAFSFVSFTDLATELGLNTETLSACIESKRAAPLVKRSLREAEALQIPGVPFFFMDGKPFTGTTVSDFSYVIDSLLAP